MILYHGSFRVGIQNIDTNSSSHDDSCQVAYFTENKAQALFYIWDETKNKRKKKWITAWAKDGVVYYEEQFSNQLRKFYEGVSGFVYHFRQNDSFIKTTEEGVWTTAQPTHHDGYENIHNVYERILQYEREGMIVVKRYDKLSRNEKNEMNLKMAKYILSKNLLEVDNELSRFISSNHVDAWDKAKRHYRK